MSIDTSNVSSAKKWFVCALLAVTFLALADHLTSPASYAIASQSGGGNSCAPCGAPCTLTE